MGKVAKVGSARAPAPVYHDDPSADTVSMHTTPDDYEYHDAPAIDPPTYSESVRSDPLTEPIRPGSDEYSSIPAPGGIQINRNQAPADKRVNLGPETSIRMDARLNDPIELEKYVEEYLRYMPPNPLVRIRGTHWETRKEGKKTEKTAVCDFDIVFSLQAYLPDHHAERFWQPAVVPNTKKVHRGGWRRTRAPGSTQDIEVGDAGPLPLHDWCQDFCNSTATLKVFRVSRDVAGFNEVTIREGIVNAIRATRYRGDIGVMFPVVDKNVDIYNPHWINRARISWVRWLFYLSFLWIFTWPLLFFLTKRWDVYHITWAWSYVMCGFGTSTRFCWRITESKWLDEYASLIKKLAVERFQGNATDLGRDVSPDAWRHNDRAVRTGNANVDSAVALIRAGADAWNTVHGRGNGNDGDWGLDS